MKVTIEYNLPEDTYEYNKFRNCDAYLRSLQDMHDWIRSKVKYADNEYSQEAYHAYEVVYDKFTTFLLENNANIDPDEDI